MFFSGRISRLSRPHSAFNRGGRRQDLHTFQLACRSQNVCLPVFLFTCRVHFLVWNLLSVIHLRIVNFSLFGYISHRPCHRMQRWYLLSPARLVPQYLLFRLSGNIIYLHFQLCNNVFITRDVLRCFPLCCLTLFAWKIELAGKEHQH